jgi:archaellum component FlaF (FlaF/FlaG flagellin family)
MENCVSFRQRRKELPDGSIFVCLKGMVHSNFSKCQWLPKDSVTVSYLASTEGKFACIVQQESNNNSRMPNM